MSYVVPPLEPCPVAVFVVVLPSAPEAAAGPTTQIVAPPTESGSMKVQEAVLTNKSVTLMELSDRPPVFTRVNL